MMRLAIAALVVATAHAGTTQEGKDFLAAKAKEEGVVTLASGMSYKVLTAAPAGAKSPLVSTPCSCHYRGTLMDGTEFDSSYKRGQPTTLPLDVYASSLTQASMVKAPEMFS